MPADLFSFSAQGLMLRLREWDRAGRGHQMHILLRGSLTQRLRIASGLVLFTFATTHFLNHAVGLVDLEAMHVVEDWRKVVTRSLPGTVVLLAALLTHIALGLFKLARRTTLRMRAWEQAPDRPRARHPVPAAPAHRQHAHCARRLRRRGQLPLRAGTAVAGERRLAEHAAADRVAARLHRHPFLAAAVPALSRPAAGAAVRCHRPAAGCARRLHGVGAHGRLLDRGCAHARQGERADALAERGRWRQPRALPLDRALRLRRHPAVRRPVHVHALHRAEPAAEECHHLHRRPDRAGAGGADAAGDQPQAQDPARVRVRRPRPLLHLPRAHQFRCQRAHAARLSRGHHARQHRRSAQRAPRLPGPARQRADRDAPAAAGQHRAQGRRPAGARTRPASRSRWR